MRTLLIIILNFLFSFATLAQTASNPIYDKEKALEKYTTCYKNYVILNNKYISVKDLALQSNEGIINRLNDIILQFDSCVILLKSNEQRPTKSPILNIDPIETYRLDGLLRPNIQTDTLQLWDYGLWAKSVLKIINSDIQVLRKSLNETDKNFSTAIKILSGKTSQEMVSVPALTKDVINLLNKYDYNSLPYNILNYKKEKADFLVATKSPINSTSLSGFSENEKRQSYFYEMYSSAIKLDSLLKKLKSFQLYKEYPKYQDYITNNYRDNEGLSDFFLLESNFVRQRTNEYLSKFRTIAFNNLQEFNVSKLTLSSSDSTELPLYIGEFANTKTQCIQRDPKGNIYLGGISKGTPFVAKINTDYSFAWKKTLPQNYNASITAIDALEEGCIVSIYTENTSNQILRFDKSGNQTFSKNILETTAARFILLDEITDHYLVAFKGNTLLQNEKTQEVSQLISYDNLGNVIWNKKIMFVGQLFNLTKIPEGYLWGANYTTLVLGDKTYTSQSGNTLEKTNILLLKFNSEGVQKKALNLPYIKPIFGLGSIKISNNNIHILGYNADFNDPNRRKKYTLGDDILHLRINGNLQIQYNNLIDF